MPHSKLKEAIARILEEEGFIAGYEVIEENPQPRLILRLKYKGTRSQAKRAITEIRLVSKPSRRVYVAKDEIPGPLGGMGICILSTSHGVLSGKEAGCCRGRKRRRKGSAVKSSARSGKSESR